VQIVPLIQPRVGRLTLFQRTPAWVLPHRAEPIPAWKRALFRRVPLAQRLVRTWIYWSREVLVLAFCKNPRWMGGVRRMAMRHLESQVPDPALRARLTPAFEPGCKRLLLSDDYYPALGAGNAEVVTEPISEVGERSIRTADGREREVDTIVLATGFRVTDNPMHARIRGRAGRSLADTWRETGMQAYLGATVAGFPNLFLVTGPNTGIGHTSLVVMIEAQIRYVMSALRAMDRRGVAAIEVRPAAQEAFNDDVQRRMARTVWNAGGCASWYLDARGRNTTLWPDFTWRFSQRTRRFDDAAYDLRRVTVSSR
jgi:cation diffusion facilitator CzcD-associated flavoprotein CzcO